MLLGLLLANYTAAALAQACDDLASLQWLLGRWTAGDEKKIITESWHVVSSRTFEGAGDVKSVPTGELVNSESLRLVEMAHGVFYLAKVAHNELPVAFKLTACGANSAVFENPAHDFPKQLEYRGDGETTLTIRVSDGGGKSFTLELTKDE